MEKDLARLIGSTVNRDQLSANIQVDSNSNIRTGSYTLSVNGFNLVDGNTFHPLHISNDGNKNGFYSLSYERQDGVLIPMEESVKGGKIGAIFSLRGGSIDNTTQVPVDGVVQNVVAQLGANLGEDRINELKEPIFCLDNQYVDEKSKEETLKYLEKGYKCFIWPKAATKFKDTNDLRKINVSFDKIANMIKLNIHFGMKGILKMKMLR